MIEWDNFPHRILPVFAPAPSWLDEQKATNIYPFFELSLSHAVTQAKKVVVQTGESCK